MGQYYKIAYKIGVCGTKYNGRKVKDCGYMMAKLVEHSYFGNSLMDAIANVLSQWKTRLAWVGDYAEADEVKKATKGKVSYEKLWGDNYEKYCTDILDKGKFDYKGKYLVNHTKKVYVSFDNYRKLCLLGGADKDWELNPISILTCIGNGRGGGDYNGTNMDYVGSWTWDLISICKKTELPKGFKELKLSFNESFNKPLDEQK